MLLSQRWALATNAVLTRANNDHFHTLGGVLPSPAQADAIKQALEKWWGIADSESMRETMHWVSEEGHSASFEQATSKIRNLQAEQGSRFDPSKLESDELRKAADCMALIGQREFTAWDAGRLVHIAGWGYIAGYLTEQEAWPQIINAATVIQRVYTSWEDYAHHYLIGRIFWGGHDEKHEGIIKDLLKEDDSPWVCIPWDCDLTIPGVPARLGPHWTKVLQAFPERPLGKGEEPRILSRTYSSGEKLLRQAEGADLVEEAGVQEWRDRHDLNISRDQWPDEWGPLPRDLSTYEGPQLTLDEYMFHDRTFNELEKKDALAAEKAILEFGYRSVGHLFKVSATISKHYATPAGKWLSQGVLDSQAFNNAILRADRRIQKRDQEAVLQKSPGLTEAIHGLSLEGFALISAQQAAGLAGDAFNALLAKHGLDLAKYQLACQGWVERMQQDSTGKLGQRYSQLYMQNAGGQYGAAGQAAGAASTVGAAASGEEPVPFEKFAEMSGAMGAWGDQGIDINTELPRVFGISVLDYGNISSYWSTHMSTDAHLMNKYYALLDKYTEQYGGGAKLSDEDDDLDEDEKDDDD